MGSDDRIYGCIFAYVGSPEKERYAEVAKANLWALGMLPQNDEYPPLSRNMFSLTATRWGEPGLHKDWSVHFGLTVKNIAQGWDEWLEKFECVLERMHWSDARVHLELRSPAKSGDGRIFAYRWERLDSRGAAPESARTFWKFEGGPRELDDRLKDMRAWVDREMTKPASTRQSPEQLQHLIGVLSRLRRYEEALQVSGQLEELDHEAAAAVGQEDLKSWAERYLMPAF